MAKGMGALSEAVYGNTQLSVRERECCALDHRSHKRLCGLPRHPGTCGRGCRGGRGLLPRRHRLALEQRTQCREKLAAEFAYRFALDHLDMDDEFWARLRAEFKDDEVADLTMCCAAFLGMGRALAVLGVRAPDERILV